MKTFVTSLILLSGLSLSLWGEGRPSTTVDEHGILRWTQSGAEVALFGVNYTTPFAHAFRAHQRLGVSVQTAIDADTYHFARLGLDAYRIHVWDREISDANGNLVVNDHVRALDYLLAKLKERGIKSVLTTMTFSNAGYPEPGVPLDGFSTQYGKQGCLENREAWPLQERYLAQFVSHVNGHTGVAYQDDPDVVAFEICNEPGHFEYAPTVEYINRMTKAIRATGCGLPVFYNMSHGLPVFAAYLDADIQGGTFQWYPANLVAGQEQRGNFLPYVDDYPIPFARDPRFLRKAKLAYEFDAADIGRSYIYPAIARTFRTAGMQIATQFAYDPLFLAPFNTEYQTHYLNLAYTPEKAIGVMVAAEAFRRVPLGQSYGAYPANTAFAGVRVSYRDDLAELVTDEKFLYSNSTPTVPPVPHRLVQVAGCGSSPVVGYPGTGAYFLDRLDAGVWRLEVMPDAIWVRDPFEKPNPRKQVCRIAWNEWPMRIDLPDLGLDFTAVGLNDGNGFHGKADGQTLQIRPGAYLLTRTGVTTRWSRDDTWGHLRLKEFVAPPASLDRTYVLHTPVGEATARQNLRVTATVASPEPVEKVELVAYLPRLSPPPVAKPEGRNQPGGGNVPGAGQINTGGARVFAMQRTAGLEYAVDLPGGELPAGTLRYHIAVHGAKGATTFPSEIAARPTDWDFYGAPWMTRIVPASAPILLFDAATDAAAVTADHRDVRYELVPSDRPGTSAMEVVASELATSEHDHSSRFFCRDKISARRSELGRAATLVVYAKSATDRPCRLQVALVTADGIAYGGLVTVEPKHGRYVVPVTALRKVRAPNIPHGYPVFIPFWSEVAADIPLDLGQIEAVLVSIGPGIPPGEYPDPHGVQIERIWLE